MVLVLSLLLLTYNVADGAGVSGVVVVLSRLKLSSVIATYRVDNTKQAKQLNQEVAVL